MKFKVGDTVIYKQQMHNNTVESHVATVVGVYPDKKKRDGTPDPAIYYVAYGSNEEDWLYRHDIRVGGKIYNFFHKLLKRKLKVGDIVKSHEYMTARPGIIRALRVDDPNQYYVEYLYINDNWVAEEDLEEDVLTFLRKLDI